MTRIFSRAPGRSATLAAVLFACLAAMTGACSRDGDPVRAALDDVVRAANGGNSGKILDRLSPDFRAADGSSRADVDATLRRLFAGYESLKITVSDVSIERSEAAALARFRAELVGRPRAIGGLDGLLPRASSYLFEVRFVPADGRWLVAWASWSQVS